MKKFFATIAAAAMFVCAQAQIVSSHSRSVESHNYSRFYVNYATLSFGGDNSDFFEDAKTLPGVQVGFLRGNSLSSTVPLYLEWGFNYQFNNKTVEDTDSKYVSGSLMTINSKETVNFMRFNVPINLAYKISIPSVEGLSITPYVGVRAAVNLMGKDKLELNGSYSGITEKVNDEYNLFDEDDMGKKGKFKRFQFGAQIGAGVSYKALYVGLGYSFDFNEVSEKIKTSSFHIGLGVNF